MSDTEKPEFPSIGEDYKIFGKLGEGAFGEVYKAHHGLLDQDFAVKLLRPELCEDEEVRARFLDEARALIRFSHPNVVQMRHVGEYGGRLFLVMDFVEGEELLDVMARDGPFAEARALSIVKQILSGLEAAHAGGIVHRDLKPSNIMLMPASDGHEKVSILDFGLSKFSAIDGVAGAHRSVTGMIVGTLAYMSPEQIKGDKDIDGRSDLFAVGLILLEMLQGHHPYPGDSGIVVAAKLLRDPIPPLEGKPAGEVSLVTKSALTRALERDRDARFPSVMAFAESLDGKGPPSDTSRATTIMETKEELARQEAATGARAPTGGTHTGGTTRGEQSSKAPLLVGVLVISALAVGAFAMFGGGDGKQGDDPNAATETASSGPDDPAVKAPDAAERAPTVEEPAVKEPAVEEPAVDEPAAKEPQPAVKEPEVAEPTVEQPAVEQPAVKQPAVKEPAVEQSPVAEPAPSAAALTPQDALAQAAPLRAAGSWRDARGLFRQAAEKSPPTSGEQLAALRGGAEAWIAEADGLARAGQVDGALRELAAVIAWLQARHRVYEQVPQAAQAARLQLGFARAHEAEAHVESARWLYVRGDEKSAVAELTKGEVAYDFALQQLLRDGVRYWELLIRRAKMYELQGKSSAMMDDVSRTTETKSVEVPAHMWVAHARAARLVAQAWLVRGEATKALEWAKRATKVAEDGVSWQDTNLTRRQWLAMARVLFVQSTLLPAADNPTALHGKLRYWVNEAAKTKPTPWADPDVAKARLLTGRAMERYLHGRVQRFRRKATEAQKAFGEASTLVDEAIGLRQAAEKRGTRLADSLPYEVRAAVATARGQSGAAKAALSTARRAAARNPD